MTTAAAEPKLDQTSAWAAGEDRSGYQAGGQSFSEDFWAYVKATEGCGQFAFTDPTFAANWAMLRRQGKRRGAYHFFHPSMSAVDQARFFWNTVSAQGLVRGDFFVVDVEILSGLEGWEIPESQALSRSHLIQEGAQAPFHAIPPAHAGVANNATLIFVDTLAGLAGPHHEILIYSNLSVAATLSGLTGRGLIIAYPAASPPGNVSPWSTFIAWQNEFGGGQGGGDRDLWHGTEADMDDWIASWADPVKPHPVAANWEEIIMDRLPTLRRGADDKKNGNRFVSRIQALCCAMGHQVTMDGIYGPDTESAVTAIQEAHKINNDGVTGPDTWSVLVTGAPAPAKKAAAESPVAGDAVPGS